VSAFAGLVRAEWTKLRTVPWWVGALLAAVVVTVLLAVLSGSASTDRQVGGPAGGAAQGPADGADETTPPPPDTVDDAHLVHRALDGDGRITARVASQEDSHEWAKAGLIVRASTEPGADYAAVLVTPDHGVRMQWGYGHDEGGGGGPAPRWLRLTRDGDTITGEQSSDGEDWRRVGSVELDGLPDTAVAGMFVASPSRVEVERQFGSESIDEVSTQGEATFDAVTFEDEAGDDDVTGPDGWEERAASLLPEDGGSAWSGDTVTITGSGDIGRAPFADDTVLASLGNVVVGLLAVVAVSVLFVTSEYRRGMIRTTFAASPRRGRALAAKAVVVAVAAGVVGLVAAVGVLLVADPPGSRPDPSLTDATVLRAVVGTGLLSALVALLALGAGTLLRRSAGAITAVVLLLVAPQVIAGALPLSAAQWLQRVTPAAGFAAQATIRRYDTALGPLAGLAVLAAYAAVAMGLGLLRAGRRDA
jgi:regulation of enolase protein 1 (concanavalin A-like superfamily)